MDIQFKILELNDIIAMKPYFEACKLHLSDYSAAFKFMWQKHFTIQFAYICNCVVFREEYQGRTYFHYPMELNDGDAKAALDELECYCRRNFIRIHFTCVPREMLMELVCRYGMELRITNHRRWKDYFYNANDFVTYGGKKFSGQRNHVNKFKKLYPEYEFNELSQSDEGEMRAFLNEFSTRQLSKGTVMAREELESVYDLLPHIKDMNLLVGAIKYNGKMIAMSIGERCGDQLIIHVEKALTDYEGIYPTMANEFAKHFVTPQILYINREDDAGDRGLRKSKLQYNPIYLIDKYELSPRRVIDRLTHPPVLHTQRLVIKEMSDSDANMLYALEMDKERCKLWGYDWRDHLKETPTPEMFLEGTREDFKNREEMPMGIYVNGEMIGEVVLHNFGYRNDCEVGMRLLPAYEGNGYAAEAVLAVMDYALYDLNMETILAKCLKENVKSKKTLTSVGLRQYKEDETYFYFRKTAAM
jgi:hypothetical protein